MTPQRSASYSLATLSLATTAAVISRYAGSIWQGFVAVFVIVCLVNLLGIVEGEERR